MPGAATLVVILDHNSVSGQAEVDNQGARAIGPEEGQIGVNLNSILGLDEQTSLFLATTAQPKQLQYGALTSTWILDPDGLRFSTSGSYSDSKPSGSIAPLDAIGHTLTVHSLFDFPLVRSRSVLEGAAEGIARNRSVTLTGRQTVYGVATDDGTIARVADDNGSVLVDDSRLAFAQTTDAVSGNENGQPATGAAPTDENNAPATSTAPNGG